MLIKLEFLAVWVMEDMTVDSEKTLLTDIHYRN